MEAGGCAAVAAFSAFAIVPLSTSSGNVIAAIMPEVRNALIVCLWLGVESARL
jgi:hypothetical protein